MVYWFYFPFHVKNAYAMLVTNWTPPNLLFFIKRGRFVSELLGLDGLKWGFKIVFDLIWALNTLKLVICLCYLLHWFSLTHMHAWTHGFPDKTTLYLAELFSAGHSYLRSNQEIDLSFNVSNMTVKWALGYKSVFIFRITN